MSKIYSNQGNRDPMRGGPSAAKIGTQTASKHLWYDLFLLEVSRNILCTTVDHWSLPSQLKIGQECIFTQKQDLVQFFSSQSSTMVGGCEASNGEKALYIGRTWWRSKVSFFTICLFPSISIITVVVNPHSKLIFFFTSPFVCFQSVWNNIVTVYPHLNWRQLDCHLN